MTALEVLGLVGDGWLADRALEGVLRRKKALWASERRAVAERVYASLRRGRTIDFLLSQAWDRFDALEQTRKDALRLAAARVLMGESVSDVERTSGIADSDRQVISRLPEAAQVLQSLPFEERFPIASALPDFLAARYLELYGADAERAAEAMNERAPLTARVNLLKGSREELVARLAEEGVDARPCPLSPFGLFLETRINAFSLPSFKEGWFELQDEGSQLLGMLVDAPPTRVVDACAGAGGKTLQLAAQMKNRGDLHALDVDAKRMDALKKRARRAGVHNVRIRVIAADEAADAQLAELGPIADRVLVDAPCTGTGTFRRKPDARLRLTEEDVAMHVERQKVLLERFSALVKPGGRLIYGTCSILPEENEEVIADFLSRHPEYSVKPLSELLEPEVAEKVASGDFLRLAPHRHGTDGFFGAVLVRARS